MRRQQHLIPGHDDHGLARWILHSALLAVAALIATQGGCRPPPPERPEPEAAPTIQPAVPWGIFNGGWRRGGEQFYAIEHTLGQSPVVTVFTNAMARAEATNVSYHGRKLEFDQIEYAADNSMTPEILGVRQVYATTGSVWRVSMRIAINNPHTLLMEKNNAEVIHKALLYRIPQPKTR